MKTFFKLLLAVIVYTVIFTIVNTILPFSQSLKELKPQGTRGSLSLLFLLINSAWICFTLFFIIRRSCIGGVKLFLNLLCVMFFIQGFMTQTETLLFIGAFPALTKLDVILLMAAALLSLAATIPLMIKFFHNKDSERIERRLNIKALAIKLIIIGLIYLCVYMVFGYFVAWQFSELRVFYSGSTEKLGFWGKLLDNFRTNPIIYPFQIIRGILFGLFIVPLALIIDKKITFVISVCLVYLCTAIMLIIPNVLFPDTVRLAHLLEMTSSMLLFGTIAGNILWERRSM